MAGEMYKLLVYYEIISPREAADKIKVICPFHGDVNASLLIDLVENKFYCFGCGKQGNVIEFLKAIEKCNDLQAMMKMQTILHSSKTNKLQYKPVIGDVRSSEELLKEAGLYYYSLPRTDWYTTSSEYMEKRGFNARTLQKSGTKLNTNDDYGIVLPIKDMGEFKGYVCRTTNKELESKRKYLYSKGFSRKNTVMGFYSDDWVVITEGSLDWLKLQQFGIHNSCAILGWKITDQQIEKIKQYTDKVISALDNTVTGREGTNILRKYFDVVRFKFPADAKDIGDLDEYGFRHAWAETLKRTH